MIVELIEIDNDYFIKQDDDFDYFVCSKANASKLIQVEVPRPISMLNQKRSLS